MNTFVNAIQNKSARTTNGMKARASSASAVVDLFFNIGAMRGKDVIPSFVSAFVENPELAIRVALWVRDVRGGAGERKIFCDILNYLAKNESSLYQRVVKRVPDLGRWKDLLAVEDTDARYVAFTMIRKGLQENNALVAKWMPRKGKDAAQLRSFLGMSPKQYRKTLVNLTKVVETQMCANDWDNINFNHVPSLASSRYKKAFSRHTEKYKEWTSALVSTDPKVKETVKVNASAVYPYDVLKGLLSGVGYLTDLNYDKANKDHIIAQWEALPNYVGNASILPIVDVSGSMTTPVGGYNSKTNLSCLDVAVSLGLYLADKNKGKFKDAFLKFSDDAELFYLKGDIIQKTQQLVKTPWPGSTNLHSAFKNILETAKNGNVPQEEMPKYLLILSDMQFNSCSRYDDSAIQMIRRKYNDAGYEIPNVVFWNLNSSDNVPVKFDEKKTALVSGFSPALVKSIISGDLEDFTSESVMMKTIMSDRYNF